MFNLDVNLKKNYSKNSKVKAHISYTSSEDSNIIVLFGPSGSGKSTILRCLAGLEIPTEGLIRFNGKTWVDTVRGTYLSPQERHIGYLFQDYALFPHLTIFNNILYGLKSLPKNVQYERAKFIMHSMQLDGLERRFPKELSGGQQQRVALARALVCCPKLLLLDEPLSALDIPTRNALRIELKIMLKKVQIPSIIITHDLTEAVVLADEMIICSEGETIQSGPPLEILTRPKTLATAKIVGIDNIFSGKIIDIDDKKTSIQIKNVIITTFAKASLHQNVLICIRTEDINIVKAEDGVFKDRNNLIGVITQIHEEGYILSLIIDCGFCLKTFIKRFNFFDMKLKIGMTVIASIDNSSIHIISC